MASLEPLALVSYYEDYTMTIPAEILLNFVQWF
jgi:hypothetical protein